MVNFFRYEGYGYDYDDSVECLRYMNLKVKVV